MSNHSNSVPKADGPPSSGMLRKALETVRRTAQAHMEAIKSAEAAFSAAAAQLAADQRSLKQEAEALARERADLDEYRGAMPQEGEEQPQPEEEEDQEQVEQPEGMEEEQQQMQQEEAEEEQEQVEELEEEADEGGDQQQVQKKGNAGKSGRNFDRSRSPRGGGKAMLPQPLPRAPPPVSQATLVEAAIERLGLDDNATRAIKMFPPEQALNLLDQVGEGVRNPSAFVTTMCNRTMQDGPSSRQPTDFERVEAAIADMGLDESATRVLHELPPEQALNMLSQVDNGVRNPSAFVMSLAHRAMKSGGGMGGGMQWQGPSLPELVEQGIQRLRLDESAARMLHELSPEHAMDILDQCGEDVRNPSAFVTAEVRKVLHGGSGRFERQSQPTPRDLSQQVAHLAKALDLDADCLDALLSISTQEAVMILERLANTASNIRNRSAFVFAEVKKRKNSAVSTPPPPVRQHGPTKTVACKFWAEGRCKNGSECRFAHD